MLRELKQRVKRLLRAWLSSILNDDDTNDLTVIHPTTGKRMPATALRIAGQMLVCQSKNVADEFCVSSFKAENEDRFWRIWKRLGGSRLQWPDGTPFDPKTFK